MTALLNSIRPSNAVVIGGVFNISAPAPGDGVALPFQVDSAGNLLVNIAAGGGGGGGGVQYVDGVTQATPTGTVSLAKNSSNVLHALSLDSSGNLNVNLAAGTISGGNAAASPTGAAVPASADYTGFNSGGNLVGVSTASPLPVAQQGSVAVTGAFFQATQPVSIAAAIDVSDRTARLLGHVTVDNFPATQPVSGTVTANQGGAPWSQNLTQVGGSAIVIGQTTMTASLPVVLASNQSAIPVFGTNTNDLDAPGADHVSVLSARANGITPTWGEGHEVLLSVDLSGNLRTVIAGTAMIAFASPQHVIADSGSVSISGTPTVDVTDRSARLLGHVTVDNASLAVTGTFFQATQPVSIAAAVDISDRAARLLGHVTVDNASLAVTGTFFQATQPVSVANLPLPSNAAQETGGNLSGIFTQDSLVAINTRNDAQLLDLLSQLLAQAKYNNMLLASSSTAVDLDDADTVFSSLTQQ